MCLKTRFSSYKNESQYFPKPYEAFSRDIKVKVDLSNYATKPDIENISLVDTSRFALKTNLAILKKKVDKLDINKLVPVPTHLSKLTAVENKIPDVGNLVKKTDYSTKVTEIENKLNNHNHDKHIDTPEFNKFPVDVFNARLISPSKLSNKNRF